MRRPGCWAIARRLSQEKHPGAVSDEADGGWKKSYLFTLWIVSVFTGRGEP